ncbi:A/G-specific adenine glycosylase [Sneathiella glossodoripedis]|uniref:A/G-specific adenine glycosylase n=1 Tax=Sneathiella glossodoripedis TaxID=418853 RepID=UPI000472E202|nr:A/G-specific adenine glycosylase [Sneathiella glossodoripedis]
MTSHNFEYSRFPEQILQWYDQNGRELPWRQKGGQYADPYHVWLSEIMLQQTTVATVTSYFEKFLHNWPTVRDLALAPLDDVLTAWAGLGYYARARNLHKCAGVVWHKYGGEFPNTEEALLDLPGIGPYTAAAIAAIAFDKPCVVIDGNIERIICRVFQLEETLPAGRPAIKNHAAKVTPIERSGDYAQALMDIGSSICRPKRPDCASCPVGDLCSVKDSGLAEHYPKKAPKKAKPTKGAVVVWIEDADGRVLMRRREEKGLLGGMMEFPSTEWTEKAHASPAELGDLLNSLGGEDQLNDCGSAPEVKHTFTHFHLKLLPRIYRLYERDSIQSNHLSWIEKDKLDQFALPTLMKKVARSVLSGQNELKL